MTAPETVNFHGTDIITSSGIGDGSYLVRILAPNISNGLQIQDCTQAAGGGCINGVAHGALPSVHTIQLNPNTVYYVDEETNTYNGALTGNGATAEIDGAFLSLAPGSTGTLQYSPGISFGSNVPEPTGWALMLVGFGGIGSLLRRRRPSAVGA